MALLEVDDFDNDVVVLYVTLLSLAFVMALNWRLVTTVPPKAGLSYRARLMTHANSCWEGKLLELMVAFASLASSFLFIGETYMDSVPMWMFCTELAFCWLFAVQFWFNFYTARDKIPYLTSLPAMVDIITVPPVLFSLILGGYGNDQSAAWLRFARMAKITRVFRLLRLLRSIQVVTSPIHDAINNQATVLVSTLLAMVIITTGFVQFVGNTEPEQWTSGGDRIHFHDAFYFTVVTFTTVGYGDVAPRSITGRITVAILIMAFIYLIPSETHKLSQLLDMRSRYSGNFVDYSTNPHIVIGLDSDCHGIELFLKEFFHEDHGYLHARVVILCPSEPDAYWKELLLRYKRKVVYLKGDMMTLMDLRRAQAQRASGFFFLTNTFAADTVTRDAVTLQRVIAARHLAPETAMHVQLIEPQNRPYLISIGIDPSRIVCANELKMKIIAQSVLWPGFSTLLTNLLTSNNLREFTSTEHWHPEYITGMTQEVYRVFIGYHYEGQSFPSVCQRVYKRFGALLVAVGSGSERPVMNPGRKYQIRSDDFGFFLAEDQKTAEMAFGAFT